MLHKSNETIASDLHKGGKYVSVSMLSTWAKCPRLFYWVYCHPQPEGRHGTEPIYTKDYLLVGTATHAGLAAYYLSGWKDGNYSLDAALAACRAHLAPRASELENDDKFAAVGAESERLLRNYWKEYGPEAKAPEYPNFRVATGPEMEPLVEVTFEVELRTGHILTVRPDMMAFNFDQFVAVDHKCPAAQSATRTFAEARLGGQGLSQEAVLQQHNLPTNGQLINVLVRGPVKNTRPFQREVVPHDPWAVQQFLGQAATLVGDILRAVELWEQLRDDGFQPVDAARVAFPMLGTLSGHCYGKFGPCESAMLCSASGREEAMLANYRVRTYKQDAPAVEESS